MKFTPAALMLTTASFVLGVGTGRSTYSMTSGPPVFLICMAFMIAFDATVYVTAAGFYRKDGRNPCFLTFCPRHSLRVRMDAIDVAAVEQVLNGNHDAFKVIVDRHSRTLFKVAFRMTGNEQDAEEVVQESLLRA